jgi:phage baseplate assembly protein gpV
MKRLLNQARREAQKVMAQRANTRIGIVTGYDPENYSAKVEIQPEGVETGWLPISTSWSGNGWGDYCPPSPGDVVDVHFQEGGKEAGYVGTRHFGDRIRPLAVPAGERWSVHESGSFLKFRNGGGVEINSVADMSITAPTVNVTGNLSVTGNILAGGDITDLNDGSGSLASLRAAYDNHRHPGVTGGGDTTSTTDIPI